MTTADQTVHISRPVWNLSWLTPGRCRAILLAVLSLGFFGHLVYLKYWCPFDLTGDEAQYWDWSRKLGLSYYSKGPAVAYIIRASCSIFGDNVLAVRLPALLLAVASSLCSYWLTRRLFGSERMALGAVLLSHVMPLLAAGSLLMTIDPPFYFCWAMATCLAAIAIFDGKRWPWPWIGVAVGVGFLAKYAMLLWLVMLLVFLLIDRPSRGILRGAGFWIAVVIALAFTTPVIMWNAQHDWGTLHHVAGHNLGRSGSFGSNVPDFITGQMAVVGPVTCVLMGGAVVWTLTFGANNRRAYFLMMIGITYLAVIGLTSFRAKVQANWPAPAYFTLTILTAYFLSTRLRSIRQWMPWRPWFYCAIGIGTVMVLLAHDLQPVFAALDGGYVWWHKKKPPTSFRKKDPTIKFQGFEVLANALHQHLETMSPGTLVLCDNYQLTAEMAFYLPNHPITYCVGSYLVDGRGTTQYDMWRDHALDQPELVGRPAIYLGKKMDPDLRAAFSSSRLMPDVEVRINGVVVRGFHMWRCFGFKGMKRVMNGSTATDVDAG